MSASPAAPALLETAADVRTLRTPYLLLALVGLGGLFNGVTGPLVSAFIPPLVQDVLGDRRTAIGVVMTIDNVLLLLLVPWAGAASDRSTSRWEGSNTPRAYSRYAAEAATSSTSSPTSSAARNSSDSDFRNAGVGSSLIARPQR